MKKKPKLIMHAELPQYALLNTFTHRFMDAAHYIDGEIERTPNQRGKKLVNDDEVRLEAFDYFIHNKSALGEEFVFELSDRIGIKRALLFCEIISNDWIVRPRAAKVLSIKHGVKSYIESKKAQCCEMDHLVRNNTLKKTIEVFTALEIEQILHVNNWMLSKHIEQWKRRHQNYYSLSSDDIYLRRGFPLKADIDTSQFYPEWNYINSYSIAMSVAEQFSQMPHGRKSALVNGDIGLFENRILFFSPFIPNIELNQLEFGIIPSSSPLKVRYQGIYSGISEYIFC